jgi:hypothetical protein
MENNRIKAFIELMALWVFCLFVIIVVLLIAKKCGAQEITGVDAVQTGRLYKYALDDGEKEIEQPNLLILGSEADYEVVNNIVFLTPLKSGTINIIASGLLDGNVFLLNKSVVVGGVTPTPPSPPVPDVPEPPKPVTLIEEIQKTVKAELKNVTSNNLDREKKAIADAIESVVTKYAATDMTNPKNQRTVRESLRLTVQRNLTNISYSSPKAWQTWDDNVMNTITNDNRFEPNQLLEYYNAIKEGMK